MRLAPAVAVAVALVLVLAGCGSDGADEASGPVASTVTVTETVAAEPGTTAETETEAAAGSECSTSGLRIALPEQDLPDAVAETRQRVFDAAVACDYDTLEQIASEEGFTFSYGGATDASDYWREAEESGEEPKPMRALASILTLPVTRNETGSYAWPSAYSESPTAADWLALAHTGLYSEEQLELMRTQGTGYLGYRTAITPDGQWQFFVAGD